MFFTVELLHVVFNFWPELSQNYGCNLLQSLSESSRDCPILLLFLQQSLSKSVVATEHSLSEIKARNLQQTLKIAVTWSRGTANGYKGKPNAKQPKRNHLIAGWSMAVVTSKLGCKYLLGVYCNFEWPLNKDHLYKNFIFQFVQGCIFPDMFETVTSIQVNFA